MKTYALFTCSLALLVASAGILCATDQWQHDPDVHGLQFTADCSAVDPFWQEPSIRFQFKHTYGKPVTVTWRIESTDDLALKDHATNLGVVTDGAKALMVNTSILMKSTDAVFAESLLLRKPCKAGTLQVKVLKVTYYLSTDVPPEVNPAPPPEAKVEKIPEPPKPRVLTRDEIAAVIPGMSRKEMMVRLGDPASKLSMPEEEGFIESFRYLFADDGSALIRLVDGSVRTVTISH
jgi:hypothetical protein